MRLTSVEMCAGGGGQALGLEQAGFGHEVLIEIEPHFCDTLRLNRPRWNVCQGDLAEFGGRPYKGTDLLAGGLPCASAMGIRTREGQKEGLNPYISPISRHGHTDKGRVERGIERELLSTQLYRIIKDFISDKNLQNL